MMLVVDDALLKSTWNGNNLNPSISLEIPLFHYIKFQPQMHQQQTKPFRIWIKQNSFVVVPTANIVSPLPINVRVRKFLSAREILSPVDLSSIGAPQFNCFKILNTYGSINNVLQRYKKLKNKVYSVGEGRKSFETRRLCVVERRRTQKAHNYDAIFRFTVASSTKQQVWARELFLF